MVKVKWSGLRGCNIKYSDFNNGLGVYSSHGVTDENEVESNADGVNSYLVQEETVWVEGLVPGIDFCNHDLKAAATWEVDGTGAATGVPLSIYLLSVEEAHHQIGEEISISYGNKGNEKAEMRCLLSKNLLDRGFFLNKKETDVKGEGTGVPDYSWSGQRKTPSYLKKLVFPEEFLTCLRTIAMQEDEIFVVTSLLQGLVDSDGERQPSDLEVRAAIWEACGDSGALQLLVDLLNTRMMDLEEGSGTEDSDTQLLEKYAYCKTTEDTKSNSTDKKQQLSRNKWASIVYRRDQKQLTRQFLKESEHALQLALSEGN